MFFSYFFIFANAVDILSINIYLLSAYYGPTNIVEHVDSVMTERVLTFKDLILWYVCVSAEGEGKIKR